MKLTVKFIFKRFALSADLKLKKSFVCPDEEANLMAEMKRLELEEQSFVHKKRGEKLQRKVEAKKCNVEKLEQQEFGELMNTKFGPSKAHGEGKMPLANVGLSCKTLNTNKLKDLVEKSYDGAKTPLDHLSGAAGRTGEAVDFLTNLVPMVVSELQSRKITLVQGIVFDGEFVFIAMMFRMVLSVWF